MPCYEVRDNPEWIYANEVRPLKDKLEKTEAYLCAIITALEKNKLVLPIMMQIDVKEAGISPDDIYHWWTDHKIKDAIKDAIKEKKDAK